MNSITKSSILEDQYIAHLAGIENSNNIINRDDKNKAYSAQKHPISNKISSIAIGSVKGILTSTATVIGVIGYPFVDSSMRAGILGSAWDVSYATGLHVASKGSSVVNITSSIVNIMKPFIPVAVNLIECAPHLVPAPDLKVIAFPKNHPYLTNFLLSAFSLGGKGFSYVAGLGTTAYCYFSNDAQIGILCRTVNYAGGVVDTIADNYLLLGAVNASLVAYFIYSKMNIYAKRELQAEEDLKQSLITKFEKIATRIIDLEENQQVQLLAENILWRKPEINKEIESLKLPNLTSKDIEQITQPVFDAAKKLRQKSKFEIVQ